MVLFSYLCCVPYINRPSVQHESGVLGLSRLDGGVLGVGQAAFPLVNLLSCHQDFFLAESTGLYVKLPPCLDLLLNGTSDGVL